MQRKKVAIKRLNGSKWIREDLRVGIIAIRDRVNGFRFCPYCLQTVEDNNVKLSLDHITPRIYGGSNRTSNLITSCICCNSKRGDKTIPEFLRECFDYTEDVIIDIIRFINKQRCKTVDREQGKELLELNPVSYWSNYNV